MFHTDTTSGATECNVSRNTRLVVPLVRESLPERGVLQHVVVPREAQLSMHGVVVGVIGARDPQSRGENVDGVPALAQAAHHITTDQLVAAVMMRRVHVGQREQFHDRQASRTGLESAILRL